MLKGCIIGAGPSGLYTAKYLYRSGIKPMIIEKTAQIGGNYKYAKIPGSPFKDILENKDIEIRYNEAFADGLAKSDCDFYVIATGGTPRKLGIKGSEYAINAMDLVKKHYGGNATVNESPADGKKGSVGRNSAIDGSNKTLPLDSSKSPINYLGDDVCIIGMGNVTFDLMDYLEGKFKRITVLSRSDLERTPVSVHILREFVEGKENDIIVNGKESDIVVNGKESGKESGIAVNGPGKPDGVKISENRMQIERMQMEKKKKILRPIKRGAINEVLQNFQKKFRLLFSIDVHSIEKLASNNEPVSEKNGSDNESNKSASGNKLVVSFSSKGKLHRSAFDCVISSIGFVSSPLEIDTEKPKYLVGWSKEARGSIDDARVGAENCVSKILEDFKLGRNESS